MNPRRRTNRQKSFSKVASWYLVALMFGFTLLTPSNPVNAQAQDRCLEKATKEVEQTSQALDEIRERLRTHASDLTSASAERAKSLLTIAFKLQSEAVNMLQSNNCRMALEFTMEARNKARAALGSLTVTGETESSLERQLVRTDELLARLKEDAPADVPQPMLAQYRRALEIQRRAWETFRSGHPRMAAKLTREAQNIAHKLQRQLHSADRATERFADNVERLKNALQRFTEGDSKCSDEAMELIARAHKALEEAVALQSDGHSRQAQTALRLANELAQKARAICGSAGRLEEEIARLSKRAEKLSLEVFDNVEAFGMVESAKSNIVEAQNLLDKGLTRAASGQLKAAALFLRQAHKLLNN